MASRPRKPEEVPLKYLADDRSDPDHPLRKFNRNLSIALIRMRDDPCDENIANVFKAMEERLADFGHDYLGLNAEAEEWIALLVAMREEEEN
jgi:hypothetical protein